MNEQKRKILNIALIIINVVIIVLIAIVSTLLYREYSPKVKDYPKIICKYRKLFSTKDYFVFINDYQSYEKLINKYSTISGEANENLENNIEYVTGNNLKFSKDFFEDNHLLIVHSFGHLASHNNHGIVSYEEVIEKGQVRVGIVDDKDYGDNIEHVYIIPLTRNFTDARIEYQCSGHGIRNEHFGATIVGNAIPISIVVTFDVIIIVYVITNNKKILIVSLTSLLIIIVVVIRFYIYISNHYTISEKPIIYLYPKEETQVSVKLGNEDKITCSYPTYTSGGWNVLAKPTGDLIDLNSGRNLYSLYYECDNSVQYTMKKDGFVVESEKLVEFLEEKLSILGLTEREAEEFIVYWLPRLQANKYNYIRFATMDEINQNMPIEFSTNPDTLIRVLMTYKPLEHPIEVEEQQLSTPERIGFVAVEWGGAQIK